MNGYCPIIMQTILHKALIVFALLFSLPIDAVDMTIDDDLFVKGSLISETISLLVPFLKKKVKFLASENF